MQLETNCSSTEIRLETPISSALIIQPDSSTLVRWVIDSIFMSHILSVECRGLNKSATHLWFSTCNPYVCDYCCVHTDGCLWFLFYDSSWNLFCLPIQYKHVFLWIAWQDLRNLRSSRIRKVKSSQFQGGFVMHESHLPITWRYVSLPRQQGFTL